jgi:hypothetical protein
MIFTTFVLIVQMYVPNAAEIYKDWIDIPPPPPVRPLRPYQGSQEHR